MSKTSKVKEHLSAEEIQKKIKITIGFWRVQKWLIIHNALNYPRKANEIANHLAVSESLVHKTISEYNRFGSTSIDTPGKGGRRNSYITIEEEQNFVESFVSKATKGHIATISEIKDSFERLVGEKVHKTTIFKEQLKSAELNLKTNQIEPTDNAPLILNEEIDMGRSFVLGVDFEQYQKV